MIVKRYFSCHSLDCNRITGWRWFKYLPSIWSRVKETRSSSKWKRMCWVCRQNCGSSWFVLQVQEVVVIVIFFRLTDLGRCSLCTAVAGILFDVQTSVWIVKKNLLVSRVEVHQIKASVFDRFRGRQIEERKKGSREVIVELLLIRIWAGHLLCWMSWSTSRKQPCKICLVCLRSKLPDI